MGDRVVELLATDKHLFRAIRSVCWRGGGGVLVSAIVDGTDTRRRGCEGANCPFWDALETACI